VGPARRGNLRAAKPAIASLLMDIVPITDRIAEHAADLRARHAKLRLPDALVTATGSTLNADMVLTGDAGWRRLGKRISAI
jgi:predicted nucleic acid-binding protein